MEKNKEEKMTIDDSIQMPGMAEVPTGNRKRAA